MPNAIFLDTNILIYAAVGKQSEPRKWDIAHQKLGDANALISAQVLAEFYANIVKKRYLTLADTDFWLERLSMMPMIVTDAALVLDAVTLSRRYQISYWDGAIVAAARRGEAAVLYSEDLNHGQMYGTVRVINPFLDPIL